MKPIWALAAAAALLAGCGMLPWGKQPPQSPVPVNELVELASDGTPTHAFNQYWKRNTLVLDMQGAATQGSIVLKRRDGAKWPVRLAFRVTPGSVGLLEVRGDQRMLIPVTREGTQAVDLELVPGVYTPNTQQITVMWEPLRQPSAD
jgi:hypothetical protein